MREAAGRHDYADKGSMQCPRRTTPVRLRRYVLAAPDQRLQRALIRRQAGATRIACAIAQTFSYEPAAISLSEKAFATAWRELAAPSLRLTFERWKATVRSEICSAWPISEVVLPPAD